MLLLQLTKIDFRSIFEQGFRLVVFFILMINYLLLFFMHFFMVRPLYSICGHQYYSVLSRWMFIRRAPSNVSAAYWEIQASCYLSNVLDVTILGFAVMFLITALVEALLSKGTQRKLDRLADSKNEAVAVGQAFLRQRITRKAEFRRLIFRMSISLVTAVFATANFISILTVFLFYSLISSYLTDNIRKVFKSSLFALKWQIIMYTFLSFFFCGLLWSIQGIYNSQLQVIYEKAKRIKQFRKMNAMETDRSTLVTCEG